MHIHTYTWKYEKAMYRHLLWIRDKSKEKERSLLLIVLSIQAILCVWRVVERLARRWITKQRRRRRRRTERIKRNYETNETEKQKTKKDSCLVLFIMFICLMLLRFVVSDDLWSVSYVQREEWQVLFLLSRRLSSNEWTNGRDLMCMRILDCQYKIEEREREKLRRQFFLFSLSVSLLLFVTTTHQS